MPKHAPDANDYYKKFTKAITEKKHIEAACYAEFALDLYYHNVEAYPEFDPIKLHDKLGDLYYERRAYEASLPHYIKVMESNKEGSYHAQLGKNYFKLKAYTLSIEQMTKAIELDGEYAGDYYHRANASFHHSGNSLFVLLDCIKTFSLDRDYRRKELMQLVDAIGTNGLIEIISSLPPGLQKENIIYDCFDKNTLLGRYFEFRPKQLKEIEKRCLPPLVLVESPEEQLKMQDLLYLKKIGFFKQANDEITEQYSPENKLLSVSSSNHTM